jgi:hypothetical protein
MFGNFRHIFTLIAILVLAGGFYYFATTENFFTNAQARAADIDKRTEQLKIEIITPLNRLKAVEIDEAFFVSTEYKTLQDMSVSLNPPVLVRSNPFAPIE